MPIDTTKTYRIAASLHLKEDRGRLLVLDPKSYAVHELNESAALVARLCDGETSCEAMVAAIVEEHGGDTTAAAQIVYRGLALLLEQQLVEAA